MPWYRPALGCLRERSGSGLGNLRHPLPRVATFAHREESAHIFGTTLNDGACPFVRDKNGHTRANRTRGKPGKPAVHLAILVQYRRRAYYGNIELGKRNLILRTLLRVAKGLGVRLSDLIRESGA
jgi:hypothetical protein